MWKNIFKVAVATTLFAGAHSLFASRAAKRSAVALAGQRGRNALYRPFYNLQAVVTFGALVLYCLRLPDRELYRIRGVLRGLMHVGQAASVIYLLYAARQVGYLRFSGAPNFWSWLKGEAVELPEPEAQGPILAPAGVMKATGPFGTMRHPLNLSMLPIIWLMPRMTANLAAFNLVTTLYLLAGSLHEEKRLRESYGEAYADYQRSVPFFPIPAQRRRPLLPRAGAPL